MGKTRVGAIVREAVGTKGSANNQSADLQALTDKYKVFCKNVKGLVNSLHQHHATLAQIGKTRLAVRLLVVCLSLQKY
jgi:hypothetical protein